MGILAEHADDDVAIWQQLLGAPQTMRADWQLPTASILTVLVLMCVICVFMLNARISAREVVRG